MLDFGYQRDIFIDQSKTGAYLCFLCDNILRQPIQGSCGHRYCFECFRHWLVKLKIKLRSIQDLEGIKEACCLLSTSGDRTVLLCPVDGCEEEDENKDTTYPHRDRAAEKEIDKLLAVCTTCDKRASFKEIRDQCSDHLGQQGQQQ